MTPPGALVLPLLLATTAAAGAPLFVDPSAREAGDGSPARPYRTLGEALRRGGEVRLRPGVHVGTWTIPDGTTLTGGPGVVLEAPHDVAQGSAILDCGGSARVGGLELRGGIVGLRVRGKVHAHDVLLTGQAAAAIDVVSGALELERVRVRATSRVLHSIHLAPGTRASLRDVTVDGPAIRGLDATRAVVHLEDTRWKGPTTAVHLEQATATVARIGIIDGLFLPGGGTPPTRSDDPRGAGPGLFAAGGSLTLSDAFVAGHEFGVLFREAKARITRLTSLRATRAAFAVVGGDVEVAGLWIVRSGPYGAVQLNGGRTRISSFLITGWMDQAVWLRDGSLELASGAIVEPLRASEGEGDAISARIGELVVRQVSVRGAPGACVLADDEARITLEQVILERCAWGVVADDAGSVRVAGASVNASEAALVAVANARITARGVVLPPRSSLRMEADCASGSRITALGSRRPPARGQPAAAPDTTTIPSADAGAAHPPAGCIWR